MRKLIFLFATFVLLVISCSTKKEHSMEISNKKGDIASVDSFGRYLYLTHNRVLHVSKNCYIFFDDINEKENKETCCQYVDTMALKELNCLFCLRCFSDVKYEHLKRIEKRNSNLYKLYEALDADGADVGTYDEFAHWFYMIDTDSVLGSRKLYNFLKEKNIIKSPDYSTFMEKLNGSLGKDIFLSL